MRFWPASFFKDPAHRYLGGIVLIAALNIGVAFDWGAPLATGPETVSPWPVDTIAPVKPLAEAYHKFRRDTDEWIVYPLFHFVVVDAAYAPYLAGLMLTGGIENPGSTFPYGMTDPQTVFYNLTLIARAVSALMALGIVVVVFQIGRHLFSTGAGLWAALFTALIAPLAFYAKTSNLDVPYLFWTLLAVRQCLLAMDRLHTRHFVLFGIFGALAIATKDQAFGFFTLTPFLFAWAVAKSRQQLTAAGYAKALVSKPILVTGAATVTAFALANNLLFGGLEGYLQHLEFAQTLHAENVSVENADLHSVGWQLTMLGDSATMLQQMLGWGTLLLAAGGVVYAAVQRHYAALVLPLLAAGYYLSVIVPVGLVLSRYLLGPAILLMPLAGALVARCLASRGVVRYGAIVVVAGSLGWQGLLSWNLNATLVRDSRIAMEQWIRANVPPGTSIETYTQPRYLPRISDEYRYRLVANRQDAVDYELEFGELSEQQLLSRNPDYILLLSGVGMTGDPEAQNHPAARRYYRGLFSGRYGYRPVAFFTTPGMLDYKQITAGTGPTTILLKKLEPVPRAAH